MALLCAKYTLKKTYQIAFGLVEGKYKRQSQASLHRICIVRKGFSVFSFLEAQ